MPGGGLWSVFLYRPYAHAPERARALTHLRTRNAVNEMTLHDPPLGSDAAALAATLPPAVLNQPTTGVHSSSWRMEASMFQRSALWVQNNEALVVGGAMSLFSASLALGALL